MFSCLLRHWSKSGDLHCLVGFEIPHSPVLLCLSVCLFSSCLPFLFFYPLSRSHSLRLSFTLVRLTPPFFYVMGTRQNFNRRRPWSRKRQNTRSSVCVAASHGFTSRQNIVPRRKGKVDGDLMGNFDFSEVWSKKKPQWKWFQGLCTFGRVLCGLGWDWRSWFKDAGKNTYLSLVMWGITLDISMKSVYTFFLPILFSHISSHHPTTFYTSFLLKVKCECGGMNTGIDVKHIGFLKMCFSIPNHLECNTFQQ